MSDRFLPMSRADMEERGWDQVDFAYVIGDAYVDHPSFGHAIISRLLESRGYRVGIISQPDWKDPKAYASSASPGSLSLSRRETWILWSIIIPFQRNAGRLTHIHRVEKWESVRTMPV